MAHFARVEEGVVREVIVVSNDDAPDEASGQAFIAALGLDGLYVQTSYNGNPVAGEQRGPFAGVGYRWDGSTFSPPTEPDSVAV